MDIENFKEKIDIITVASDLSCLPLKHGRVYQGGKCPSGHESKGGECFTIYPDTESAYCFNCGKSWDVIGLVQDIKRLDFFSACNWLAEKYGLPYLQIKDMTPEEKAEREARIQDQRTVFSILTEAARFYYKKLMEDDEIKGRLVNHYGLSKETITKYAIGSTGENLGLWRHLHGLGFSTEDITSTGLFLKVGGTWREFFQQRIIFPYWKSGQVVYFIGRRTDRTPDLKWERAKYKKLQTRSDRKPYISEFIKNEHFYGEDSLRGAKDILIPEGVTDCLAMLQADFPSISPTTTNFKKDDLPRLEHLLRNVKTVYLVPDSEKSKAGIKGAFKTALKLEGLGKSVYIVTLPRPEGVEKIDANEFLRDHGKKVFEKLIGEAKTLLQLEIDDISKERLDLLRLSDRLGPVKQKISMLPQDKQASYLDYAKRVLKVKADFIQAIGREIKRTKCDEAPKENETETLSALFPELVDLVVQDGKIAYLYKSKAGLKVDFSFDHSGVILIPPSAKAIPFTLIPVNEILSRQNDSDATLYWNVLEKLKAVSILPSERYYHLCSIYSFFTYVWESCAYYPYLWFFGLAERGKSRIVKAIINLSHRGLYTETLNEAYIFRFADLFRGTLALDLYELSERVQKKGSHDLLLGRYERGMRVARVIAPDKGAFRDTEYFTVSGPTVLATNIEIPSKDPLQSRCIKITMPEARAIYPNNNTDGDLIDLKAGLLAFRARHLGEALPQVNKPIAGRLGDIMQPLLCVAKLLPGEATEALTGLIEDFESDRREAESESLSGRIAEAFLELQDQVELGRLPVESLRDELNKDVDEKYHLAPQTIGRELSAMGLKRKKSDGKMQIIFDLKAIEKIWARFSLSGGNLPNLPNLPEPDRGRVSDREVKNGNLPNLPESREEREKAKINLPAGEPYKLRVREIREEREISPGDGGQHTLFDEPEECIEGEIL